MVRRAFGGLKAIDGSESDGLTSTFRGCRKRRWTGKAGMPTPRKPAAVWCFGVMRRAFGECAGAACVA